MKKIFYSLIAVVLVSGFVGGYVVQHSKASSSIVVRSTNTLLPSTIAQYASPLATTSVTYNYMTPGTGTTTLALYTNGTDAVGLNILFVASSTSSVLNWHYEYSNNGIDWYTDDFDIDTGATTTVAIPTFKAYTWTFASSTGLYATSGSGDATHAFKHINLTDNGEIMSSPYVRVVFNLASGSANGAVNVQAALKTNNVN